MCIFAVAMLCSAHVFASIVVTVATMIWHCCESLGCGPVCLQVFMLMVILVNSIVMCMPYYDQTKGYTDLIRGFNQFFLVVYVGRH